MADGNDFGGVFGDDARGVLGREIVQLVREDGVGRERGLHRYNDIATEVGNSSDCDCLSADRLPPFESGAAGKEQVALTSVARRAN